MVGLADLLFPSSCVGCGRLARGGLCRDCIGGLKRLGPQACAFCGGPVEVPVRECRDCLGRDYRFDSARQAVEFSSTSRRAIHNFKYRSERCLATSFALLLGDLVDPEFSGLITWVPPQPDRKRQRGFDHGEALAVSLGRLLGNRPSRVLRRVRPTDPQMRLPPEVRRQNLIGAFEADSPVSGDVLVVDDVFTTGATATEAARALKEAGATSVEVVCIARAIPNGKQPRPSW